MAEATNRVAMGVVGAAGRMGTNLVRLIRADAGARAVAASERPGHRALGRDAGEVAGGEAAGVVIHDDAAALFREAEVVLDFTSPAASVAHARLAAATGTALVVGTTGLEAADEAAIAEAAGRTAILRAANFSLGVNLLAAMVRDAARLLDADFDIEIVEMHHRHKVDAPSGTALLLGRAAAAGRGADHDDVAVRGRDGITGARPRGGIGYASLRGGNVAGEHTVVFAADDERIELTHRATDRAIFARGGVKAGIWLRGRPPGLYSMADVLGFAG